MPDPTPSPLSAGTEQIDPGRFAPSQAGEFANGFGLALFAWTVYRQGEKITLILDDLRDDVRNLGKGRR